MAKFAGRSDTGLLRNQNEDAFCIVGGETGEPLVLVVADGMGGHLAGDIASQSAISTIRDSLSESPIDTESEDTVNDRLLDLVQAADDNIFIKSQTEPGCFGMGTTLIIAVVSKGSLAIAHVGDSCAYYLRDGSMKKITTDHTYVEELVRIGTLTREEAARHPKRNIITKVVGWGKVSPDLYRVELHAGDRVLLCTDGISKMLAEPEIAETMLKSEDPEEICGALIATSNNMGGLDNITVLVYINGADG